MKYLTMDEHGYHHGSSNKLNGIRHIVKFKEIIQKWQSATLGSIANNTTSRNGSNPPHCCSVPMGTSPIHSTLSAEDSPLGNLSPVINRHFSSVIACDSDNESCASQERAPLDVPEGYLAVYVGQELRRFIIPTSYLSHNLFKVLLEKAEEEFGFDHSGGLTIPCETETFKYLLKCMENHQKAHPDDTPAGAWKIVE